MSEQLISKILKIVIALNSCDKAPEQKNGITFYVFVVELIPQLGERKTVISEYTKARSGISEQFFCAPVICKLIILVFFDKIIQCLDNLEMIFILFSFAGTDKF